MDRRTDGLLHARVFRRLATTPDAWRDVLENLAIAQRLADLPDARSPLLVPRCTLANLRELLECSIEIGETNRLDAVLGEHPKDERRPRGTRRWNARDLR
jgi:hypothetical protein